MGSSNTYTPHLICLGGDHWPPRSQDLPASLLRQFLLSETLLPSLSIMSASQPDSQGSIISSFSLDKPPTTLCSSPTALPVLMNSHTGSCPGLGRRPSPPWIPSHPSRAGLSASSPRSFPFSTATAVWIPLLGPPPAQEWSSPARRLFQLCPRGAEGSRGRRRWGSSLCPQSGRRANACNLTLPFHREKLGL